MLLFQYSNTFMLCSSTRVLNSIILHEQYIFMLLRYCKKTSVLFVDLMRCWLCVQDFLHAYMRKLSYFSIVWPIWFGWTDTSVWLKNNWWHVIIIIIMLWYYVTHQLLLKHMWYPLVCRDVGVLEQLCTCSLFCHNDQLSTMLIL